MLNLNIKAISCLDNGNGTFALYCREGTTGRNPLMRVWTNSMAAAGQFEEIEWEDFEKFRILYEKLFVKRIKFLGDNDRYEPGDNLDS